MEKRSELSTKYAWLVVLVLCLGLLGLETRQRIDRVKELSSLDGGFSLAIDDSDSLSGYAGGVRQVVASDRSDDLHWVVQSQVATAQGQLRLRQVNYDNAPQGRLVHWSSLYAWWIRLLAFGEARNSEWAVLAANVVLVALVMLGLSFYLRLQKGGWAAVALCLGFSSFIPFRDVFKFGMGDHHAAAILSVLLATLFFSQAIRSAWQQRGGQLEAIASSFFMALGMWVNLVTALPVLLAVVGSQGVARIWIGGNSAVAAVLRSWARMGALFACVFYFLEYAPECFSLRLEVNHPLYSLAWLAFGGGLAVVYEKWNRSSVWRLTLHCLLLLPIVLVFVIQGREVFQVADPFLMAIHNRHIMEFQSLGANVSVMSSSLRILAMLLPLAILPIGIVALLRTVTDESAAKAQGLVAMACASMSFILTLYQARWWALTSSFLVLVLVDVLEAQKGRVIRWMAIGSLAPGFIVFMLGAFTNGEPVERELTRVAERSVAHFLRARAGDREIVVLASPDATTNQIYYGGAKGIGTFYWENNEGMKRAAAMFASSSMEVAKERLQSAGVTHVIIYSWGGFEKEYLDLYRDFEDAGESEGKSFLLRLLQDQEIPLWLRPIPYQFPDKSLGIALIYEVVADASYGKLASRKFEYFLEMGLPNAAYALERELVKGRKDFAARVSLCRLYALQKRVEELSGEIANLQGVDVSSKDLGDAIRYCGVLAISGQTESARRVMEELIIGNGGVTLSALRGLNPEAVRHLWEICDALGVAYELELREQSWELIPYRLRP